MKFFVFFNQAFLIKSLYLLNFGVFTCCFQYCKPGPSKGLNAITQKEIHHKPPAVFQDTMIIDSKTAVFYQPDSIQLNRIKSLTDSRIFDGSMHEYDYQIRTAHLALNRNWPQIKAIEAKDSRYLAFKKDGNNKIIIDLDKYDDAYGMFLFEAGKNPVPVDMTNVEQAIYFYFSK